MSFLRNIIWAMDDTRRTMEIYKILDAFSGVDMAIKNAERRMAGYDKKHGRPSEYNPGTMVYQLVEELREYLK